ncbi:MAG: trypsin-like peptidase domain-containing protein [Gemmatales bacterium]|nr:trypsin-like peptidase domain-containing protein [Gemmatales bacterium]
MATLRCSFCGSTRGSRNARGEWVCYACGQTSPAGTVSFGAAPQNPEAGASLTISCPRCGATAPAPANSMGRTVRCTRCGETFTAAVTPYGAGSSGRQTNVGFFGAGVPVSPGAGQCPTMPVPLPYVSAAPTAPLGSAPPSPPGVLSAPPPPMPIQDSRRLSLVAWCMGGGLVIVISMGLLFFWLVGSGSSRRQAQLQPAERMPQTDADHRVNENAPKPREQSPAAGDKTEPVEPQPKPGLPTKPDSAQAPVKSEPDANLSPQRPAEQRPANLQELFARLAPSVPLVLAKLDANRGGHGSGFVVHHNGDWYVATNNHVVEVAASGLELIFLDAKGKLLLRAASPRVRITRMSRQADVALIDCNAIANDLRQRGIQPVRLAPHGFQPAVGEKVFAIGHPASADEILPQTLTEGIISGVGRKFRGLEPMQFLQTTASVNPGNSGGPLFDFNGQVVGVNTLVIRRTPDRDVNLEGLNFALEIRHLHDLLRDPDVSYTEREIDEMLQRRVARRPVKPVELKPEVRKVLERQFILGLFAEQRFTFRLQAGEVCVLAAQPVGVEGVLLTLFDPQGRVVAIGVQTFDNEPMRCEIGVTGVYTLQVANANFAPAEVRLVVGAARVGP